MKLRTFEYVLPEHWASYLINNDPSGITPESKAAADNFLSEHGLPSPVSCSEEPYFSYTSDAGPLIGNVLEYVFVV